VDILQIKERELIFVQMCFMNGPLSRFSSLKENPKGLEGVAILCKKMINKRGGGGGGWSKYALP